MCAGGYWVYSQTLLEFETHWIQRLGSEKPFPVLLPFKNDSDKQPGTFHIYGDLNFTKGMGTSLRVLPVGCIKEMQINGNPLDLHSISASALCDSTRGFEINLSHRLRIGTNKIQWKLSKDWGSYGLNVLGAGAARALVPINTFVERLPAPWRQYDWLGEEWRLAPGRYLIQDDVHRGDFAQDEVTIFSHACVEKVELNGQTIEPNGSTLHGKCLNDSQTVLNLGEKLKPGESKLRVLFNNHGGSYFVDFEPTLSDPLTMTLAISELLLLWLAWTLALSLWVPRLKRIWRHGPGVWAAVLAFSTMLRFAFIFVLHRPDLYIFQDMFVVAKAAQEIATGHFLPKHLLNSIIYPVLMAISLKWSGGLGLVQWLHFFGGMATAILSWRGSARILGEKKAAWVLIVMAFHFPLISLSGFYMSDTLFSFFIAFLFYLTSKWRLPWTSKQAVTIGLVTAIGIIFKGNNVFFVPLLTIWIVTRSWVRGSEKFTLRLQRVWGETRKSLTFFFSGMALVMLLTGIFTDICYGQFQFSSSSGGINLVQGKCQIATNVDSNDIYIRSPLAVQLNEKTKKVWPRPFEDQAFFMKEGLNCIKQNPIVLITSFRYIYYLFFDNQLWPANVTRYLNMNRYYSLFYSLAFFPGIILGLIFLLRKKWAGNRLPYLLVLSLFVCSWAIQSELRYRVVYDSIFIPISILGWAQIARVISARRGTLKINR